MPFTIFEKAVAVLFFLGTLAFYLAFAWARVRPFGATLRARIDALLALREPAILLDSARVIALVGWMRNTPDVGMAMEYLRRGVAWTDPVGVFRWVNVLSVPPLAVPVLVWAYRVALGLAICGVWGRAACLVAALLHALAWSIGYSTVGYSVHNHVVFMILLTLALAPQPFVPIGRYARLLRARRPLAEAGAYFSYVRFAAAFAIVTVYVQTGIEKVLHGSPRWFNGITLQGHSMRKGELSTWLATLPLWVLSLLAVGVVLWETLFGLVFFYKKLRPIGVASGWGFHELVRYVMGVRPFAFMMTSVLFVYTPYEAWTWIAARRKKAELPDVEPAEPAAPREGAASVAEARPAALAPTLRTASVVVLVALMAAQWAPTFLRRGVYPFLGNAMFSSSLLPRETLPAEIRMVARTSDGAAREIYPPDAIAVHSITFTGLAFARYRSPYKDQIALYAGTQERFCQDLLRSIALHAEPRATTLELHHDYFVAGTLGLQTEIIQTCKLPELPEPLPPPSSPTR